MNYFKLGIRNILRNTRRSIATAFAVAFGFAAINLFSGYIHNVYAGLGNQAVRSERLGHLTVTKKDALNGGKLEPEKFIFAGEELQRLVALLKADDALSLVALRLGVSGIVSNGDVSTIFIGEGMAPEDIVFLQGDFRRDRGTLLDPERPGGAAVASDLASMLHLTKDSYAVLVGSTVTGQTNAIDIDVGALFNTGNAGTNDKYIVLPLNLAQQLLNTDGADRIILMLKDGQALEIERVRLAKLLKESDFDLDLHSWQELSAFYTKVRNLFDMIFTFIFAIVLVIVLMSIVNTMSMSVVERTREIGTLRALGMNGRKVIYLFTVEGLLLVLVGGILGLIMTGVIGVVVNLARLSYTPPNNSDPVLLLIDIVPPMLVSSFVVLAIVAAFAALLPARRASRQSVVDALSHT